MSRGIVGILCRDSTNLLFQAQRRIGFPLIFVTYCFFCRFSFWSLPIPLVLAPIQKQPSNQTIHNKPNQTTKFYTSLKSMQEKLKTIQSAQGASLDELEKQLQESKNIYNRMELNLQGEILQNLLSVIMACDNDGDQLMDDDDIERLIHKLEGIQGVDLKDEMIRKKIVDCGRSLNGASCLLDYLLACCCFLL
jgi:hypothetical protein